MAKLSLRQGAGLFEIDHRDSPGITEADVAHLPPFLRQFAVPGGQHFERDILVCSHCQQALLMHPFRVHDRGHCPKCYHYLCDRCEGIRVKTGECKPMAKVFDQILEHHEQFVGREDNPAAQIVLTDVP